MQLVSLDSMALTALAYAALTVYMRVYVTDLLDIALVDVKQDIREILVHQVSTESLNFS